jgi:phenylalanyl-tRNA synthetase beta chain
MRTNLWPGLIGALQYNKSRQQQRVRLFETGVCFRMTGKEISHALRVGGLITGLAMQEQWGAASRQADFYDLKGDIENILALSLPDQGVSYQVLQHPALHPGQSAAIYHQDRQIGIFGALHPVTMQALDLTKNIDSVYIFELDLAILLKPKVCQVTELSKFPEIRRDIAIIVNDTVPAKAIQDTIKGIAGDWLKDIFIFDVYKGKGISPGLKSIAVGLILQHPTRTLVDDEVTALMDNVTAALKDQIGAELRR